MFSERIVALFALGRLVLVFFQVQVQLSALDPQPFGVVVALAQPGQVHAPLAQAFELRGGILLCGRGLLQGDEDAGGQAKGQFIGELCASRPAQ
jgi:hypothetical protein